MNHKNKFMGLLFVLGLLLITPLIALKGKPTFSPALFADGEVWGTKAAAILPEPKGNNLHSFDKLFVILNSNNPMGQLPVAEAAPRNFGYNGGRWYTHTVEWTPTGFAAHGIVPILKSMEEVMLHYQLGHLMIYPGSFEGGPPEFFLCPLLPIK